MNQGTSDVLRRLERLEHELAGQLQRIATDSKRHRVQPENLSRVVLATACVASVATIVTVCALKGLGLL